jgi:hypothetical protein
MTNYLPDLIGVEVGSPMQDDLRYALDVLRSHKARITDPDEWDRCGEALLALESLTRRSVHD